MAEKPRIFHGLYNVAGIPAALAEAERAKGYDSKTYCYSAGVFHRRVDQVIDGLSPAFFARAARSHDIFNFHFGNSLLGGSLKDLPILRAMGKSVFMHFHGCDIRDSKSVIEKYAISPCMTCWPMQCSPNRNLARTTAQKHASRVFVSTPDLIEFVNGAIWLPQAIDAADIYAAVAGSPGYQSDPNRIVVAHAPSSTTIKGSTYVEKAVATLQTAGVPIELKLLTRMSHTDVIKAVQQSDIFIDQLLIGSYGVAALEAMILRKPVIVYIRDDLVKYFGADAPMISANPTNLVEVLYDLTMRRRADWGDLGARGEAYVARTHAIDVISNRLCSYY